MTQPQALLPRIRALLSLAVLCGACALTLPAHALQTSPQVVAGAGRPVAPTSLREALALTPAQATLWQAALDAAREAHAHALELQARFIREGGGPGQPEGPESSLRARAEREDRLHDALDKDRRAARDRWITFEESLDAGQRRHLHDMPEGRLAVPPQGTFGPGAHPFPGAMPGPMPGRGPAPMPCAFGANSPFGVPGAAGPHQQGAPDAR
ncbi:hypothetical protein [Cupriavidus basilensis]|uniref:Uncharacterized protein n=1 Tax=Cupriavidus basilensis TaxID=68895 RepID=A0A0C4YLB7_9BURK|nr:hypothetical protein [Cupriavidus basilensis]AJG21426.1 hypothetical protein RR42_m4078 [Cupriavidus basilensis]